MRIALLCNDTRGGVQPYVALGLGLRRAGHDVRAVAPSDLASLFSAVGIPVTPLSGSIENVLRRSGGVAEHGLLATMRFAAQELPARLRDWTRATLQACEGDDVLTGGVGGMVIGLSVAEKLGKPFVQTHLQPIAAPTGAYPGVLTPGLPNWVGPWGRRLSHHVSQAIIWAPFKPSMATARRQVLGLAGRQSASAASPVLYCFSPHVVPLPQTITEAGGPQHHVTGYWVLPPAQGQSPPPALQAFLDRPGPVVSVGFGSMASKDPRALTHLVRQAARDAGVRVVLLSGWGGLGAADDDADCYCADAVAHDWLFARMSAVVHHGGAGTTGAALMAGVPSLVVPFTMDQPFWARRVHALGAGPAPIPRRHLSQQNLAAALTHLIGDQAMRQRTAALGELIRAEDGVARAVEVFERIAELRISNPREDRAVRRT
jgi:sterol 3beta-glucosyltransferase